MTYTTASKFSPYPTIPESVIETIQRAHLVTAEWSKHVDVMPKTIWKIPHIEPFKEFHPLLHTAQKIAAQQVETLAALQRIPQMTVNQALLGQSAKMTAIVQSLHTSIAASGIMAALEISEAMRSIPVEQMRRLLSIYRPSYVPPFVAYGLSTNASSTVVHHRQTRKRQPTHPRTRLIERVARQEFVQISAAALVLIQTTSPEILESVKTFSQSINRDNMLAILGPSAAIIAEQLSPNDRKALLWIVWILTMLLVFNK